MSYYEENYPNHILSGKESEIILGLSNKKSDKEKVITNNKELTKLEYCSTNETLFLKFNIPGLDRTFCVPTARLYELLLHRQSYGVKIYYNDGAKIMNVRYNSEDDISINVGTLVFQSKEIFSYAVEYTPKMELIRMWNEQKEEPVFDEVSFTEGIGNVS